MGKRLLTLVFIIYSLLAAGQQNLVPNPSFEIITACPNTGGQIDSATPWFQPASSADLFHVCSSNPNFTVPSNKGGFQNARTGQAYGGIGLYTPLFNSREYIEVKLIQPLKTGKRYCVEFYISLTDTSAYGISNIGVYFSSDSIIYTPTPPPIDMVLPYTPQITNTQGIIADKSNWTLVFGEFIANGGEQFITIGNFDSDANTISQQVDDGDDSPVAFYYIDDVSVTCCDESGCDALDDIPNVFTPNGDGLNDAFIVEATGFEGMSCEIYNRWGIKVASLSEGNPSWDGRTTSGQEALEGVYYYVVRARDEKGEEISRTGFVQLLR